MSQEDTMRSYFGCYSYLKCYTVLFAFGTNTGRIPIRIPAFGANPDSRRRCRDGTLPTALPFWRTCKVTLFFSSVFFAMNIYWCFQCGLFWHPTLSTELLLLAFSRVLRLLLLYCLCFEVAVLVILSSFRHWDSCICARFSVGEVRVLVSTSRSNWATIWPVGEGRVFP